MKHQIKLICTLVLLVLLAGVSMVQASDLMARKGVVQIYDNGNGIAKLHTYMAPYEAAANTASIIELKDSLIIVDFQFAEPFAKEFRAYADSLGKPIARAYLSHEHPDHWLGSIAFQDVDTYALPEVVKFVNDKGDAIIKKKGKPGKRPSFAGTVQLGKTTLDGLTLEFKAYDNAESQRALVIAIPQLGAILAQDLLYSNTHLYLGNDNFDSWIASLKNMKQDFADYQWFVPGHGPARSTASVIDENIAYLNEANVAFAATGGELSKIQEHLLAKFADYKCQFFIPFSVGIALKHPQQQL